MIYYLNYIFCFKKLYIFNILKNEYIYIYFEIYNI